MIAQASHATGANSDLFRTDLYVTNVSGSPATFKMTLLPRVVHGTPPDHATVTLGNGDTYSGASVATANIDGHEVTLALVKV